MLNTKVSLTSNVSFNTPAVGTLQKSHAKSVIRLMQVGSALAGMVFSRNPTIEWKEGHVFCTMKIVVLQTMLMSDNYLMVEYVKEEEDF